MIPYLWTNAELVAALSVAPQYGTPAGVTGVSIDSRTLQPGDLFVALRGDPGPSFKVAVVGNRDGHDFVAKAFARGAAGAVVHRLQKNVKGPQYCVNDSLDGLWNLGRFRRQAVSGKIVAITGSSGKTTLKYFLEKTTLGYAGQGNLNNFWGVPLAMSRMPKDCRLGIFELGMNHPGEIAPLARLVNPDVAMILNVLVVHQENFLDLDAIIAEKLSIIQGLKDDGTLVLPDSLAGYGKNHWRGRCITFGTSPDADVCLQSHTEKSFSLIFKGHTENILNQSMVSGEHRQKTLAATAAGVIAVGENPTNCFTRLASVSLPSGRGNMLNINGINVIDDSYNANPVSMCFAIKSLLNTDLSGRRYALLGEMLELGADSENYHLQLVSFCNKLDGVWLVGLGMQALAEVISESVLLSWSAQADTDLLKAISVQLQANDCLLIKGSNSVFWQKSFVDLLCKELPTLLL